MSYENPRLIGTGEISAQSVYEARTTPLHLLGDVAVLNDGREFVYVANRGTAITAGKLCKYNEVSTNTDLCVIPTQTTGSLAVGSRILNVTLAGSSTFAEHQLVGDYLNIDDDTGEGRLYRILGNTAVSSGTAITLNIEPLRAAITTSTTVTVVSRASDVQIADANQTQKIAGVTQFDVGAGSSTVQYFWIQRRGLTSCLVNGTPAVGTPLIPSGTTAGAVDASAEAGSGIYDQIVGVMVSLAGVSTEHHVIDLSV